MGGHFAGLSGVLWFVENVLRLRTGPDQIAPKFHVMTLDMTFGLVMRPDVLENWADVGTCR